MSLKDKVTIVTGAVGGIGEAIVEKFLKEGSKVLAVDLNKEALEGLAKKHPSENLKTLSVNVTNHKEVANMVDHAVSVFGTLDVVINNAGIGLAKPLIEHDVEKDFDSIMDVNVKGVYYGIHAAGKKFVELKKPGVILSTSSVYGTMAAELTFTYNTTKAAVDMMTKCAALELSPYNVRVAAVAPGRVDTPMLRKYEAVGLWEHIKKEQMRNNFTQPEEIANVFAFLSSEDSNCINGTTIYAEDGFANFKYPLMPK